MAAVLVGILVANGNTLVTFKLRGGWGFIKEQGLYAEVFVNRRDVESHLWEGHPDRDLYPGDTVTCTRHFGEKGWFALNVHKKRDPVAHSTKAPVKLSPMAMAPPCVQATAKTTATTVTPMYTATRITTFTVTTTETVVATEPTPLVTHAKITPEKKTVGTQTPKWDERPPYVVPGGSQYPKGLPPPVLPPGWFK